MQKAVGTTGCIKKDVPLKVISMDEQQAINLLKRGDLKGLDVLVPLYYTRAVKTAYLIVQDRDEAEDIVQNAFLHACEKISQLAADRFGPWFLRSVVNASIKAARRQKRQVSLSAQVGEAPQALEDLLVDRQLSPEAQVETSELSQAVWRALQALSPGQRAAVVMKYYLEMSEAELTGEFNQPVSTVKWRLYTARQKLRNLLHPYVVPPKASLERNKKRRQP